ncbi:hypothetical protein [uncultured Thiocystis sp.]|jgi:predicted secreted protein|uniref:hypothetical protein n=1 Tax=uncultured Thiocystis sp. TaxID=1202134 RepID=UPI0025D34F3C|nr:hypothetical protein [uncultured Thiocystis sp.]
MKKLRQDANRNAAVAATRYLLLVAIVVAGLISLLGSAGAPTNSAPTIATTDFTFNNANQKSVVDQLVSRSMSSGMSVISATEYLVVAETRDASFGAMFIYGSKYDRTPAFRIKYNIASIGNNQVRVNGRAEMITNPGSAFERSTDVTAQASQQINANLSSIAATFDSTSHNEGKDKAVTNTKKHAATSGNQKPINADEFSGKPDNAGGVSLVSPAVAENGNVVPFTAIFSEPVMPGDKLIVTTDGNQALQMTTEGPPVTAISSRLRMQTGKLSVYIVRRSGRTDSATRSTGIGKPANPPNTTANKILTYQGKLVNDEFKIKLDNDMGLSGFARQINITLSNAKPIIFTLTPYMSSTPFIGIKSLDNLSSATVAVML